MSQEEEFETEMSLQEQLDEELTKAYLGGLLDGSGSITVAVRKSQDYAFGFYIEPELTLNKSKPYSVQIIDDWAASNGIYGSAGEYEDRYQFRMNRARDIARLLEILRPYIQDRREIVDLMLEDILPLLQESYHLESKENFIEVVEMVDTLKELSVSTKKRSKYTADYFREEWADELDG